MSDDTELLEHLQGIQESVDNLNSTLTALVFALSSAAIRRKELSEEELKHVLEMLQR